jgi:hypothetical protein
MRRSREHVVKPAWTEPISMPQHSLAVGTIRVERQGAKREIVDACPHLLALDLFEIMDVRDDRLRALIGSTATQSTDCYRSRRQAPWTRWHQISRAGRSGCLCTLLRCPGPATSAARFPGTRSKVNEG